MMAFYYDEETILLTYRLVDSTSEPASSDLEEWDANLRNKYETRLNEYLPQYGIPTGEKSRVLLLAVLATGTSIQARIKNACEYHRYIKSRGWELS